jgi:hypothetical protein
MPRSAGALNLTVRVRAAGSDGAFIRANPDLSGTGKKSIDIEYTAWSYDGAELRAIPVAVAPIAQARHARAWWPAALAVGGIVLALDHGNIGVACIIGIWLLGWTANR